MCVAVYFRLTCIGFSMPVKLLRTSRLGLQHLSMVEEGVGGRVFYYDKVACEGSSGSHMFPKFGEENWPELAMV